VVTSIGGTQLHLNDKGDRVSGSVYKRLRRGRRRPVHSFTRSVLPERRERASSAPNAAPGRVDAAAVNGGAWTYSSFDPTPSAGTSTAPPARASPLFSGIVALADQRAGTGWQHQRGPVRPGEHNAKSSGLVDVNDGTNNAYAGVTAVHGRQRL